MAATLSEESLGYPDDVEFVPGDQEWADDVVWRNLADEGRATVIVDEETELLLIPPPDRPVAWMRPRARHPPPPRAHRRIRDLQHPWASPRARDARARTRIGPKEQRRNRHDRRVCVRAQQRKSLPARLEHRREDRDHPSLISATSTAARKHTPDHGKESDARWASLRLRLCSRSCSRRAASPSRWPCRRRGSRRTRRSGPFL